MTPDDTEPDDFDDQSPVRDEHYEYETHLADDDYYGDLRYEEKP